LVDGNGVSALAIATVGGASCGGEDDWGGEAYEGREKVLFGVLATF